MDAKKDELSGNENIYFREIACWILLIFPVVLFIIGTWNLYLASDLGQKEGHSLFSLFRAWNQGIDLSEQYSGVYLRAMRRLTTAIVQLSFAFLTFCSGLVLFRANKGEKQPIDK